MTSLISRILVLSILSFSLMACGFHLRGKINVPDSLQRVHIKGNDKQLNVRLGKSLAFSNIQIVEAAEGVSTIDLSSSDYKKEVNGTSDSGIATSYKLIYTLVYDVLDANEVSLQKHSLKQSRTLAYNAANILLFEREEAFLKEDMQKELINQMLRRISKIK